MKVSEDVKTLNETAALCLSLTGAMGEKWFSDLFLNKEPGKGKLYLGRAYPGLEAVAWYESWYEDWKRGANQVFPLLSFWDKEELEKLISISGGEEDIKRNLNRFYESSGKRGWRYVEEGVLGAPVQNFNNSYPGYFVYMDVQETGSFFVGVGKKMGENGEVDLSSSKHLYAKGNLSKYTPQVSIGIYRTGLELSEDEDRTSTLKEIYELSLVSLVFPEDGDDDDRDLFEKLEEENEELKMMFLGLSSIISSSIAILTRSATTFSWGNTLVALTKANYLLSNM